MPPLLLKCNPGATLYGLTTAWVAAALVVLAPARALAQGAAPSKARPAEGRVVSGAKFLAGAAFALGMHEGAHMIGDVVFDAGVTVKKVTYGPFPFFAITHRSDLSPRREFTISSAGFWAQEAASEWLLARHPALRHERAPVLKGLLAFDVLTSVGYAATAFARAGPVERDTRGMASSIGVDEPVIGVFVLAPAVLDAYRYFRPESRWARWASRAAKAGMVALVFK
ncbi:MAG: hypothetical protein ACM3SQ_06800 [Betaproteobacteria bacterium]